MRPVFDDDFWKVCVHWSKAIPYEKARDVGSHHDQSANLYMISVRFSDNAHKPVYIGKTYRQNIATRLKQPDHRGRYAAIIKNHPHHKVFVRYGNVTVENGKITEKRIKDIESILIYCYDSGYSRNIKSIYKHGVTDSYEIVSSGSKCELPKRLSFGFFCQN